MKTKMLAIVSLLLVFTSITSAQWSISGNNIYYTSGNVGIGTDNPQYPLDVAGRINLNKGINGIALSVNGAEALWYDGTTSTFSWGYGGKRNLFYDNVSIGWNIPLGRIDIQGGADNTGANDPNAMAFQWRNGGYRHWIRTRHNAALGWGNAFDFYVNNSTSADGSKAPGTGSLHVMTLDSGNVGIGTENPVYKLDVKGTTATDALVIRGGADLAEPFSISDVNEIPKGALVVIDEENPGRLKMSNCPYDKRVAGVVSGAGGLNPGLTLSQRGIVENGINVALSGRVYALADCSNGAIKPGDMLTTSSIQGHAMKATDRERSYGAVIGKAMSSLEQDRGLVLVLVSLQ